MSNKLESLIEKYNGGITVKERMIGLKLQYIKELYGACSNPEDAHLFHEIIENFCEIIERIPPADTDVVNSIPWAPHEFSFTDEFRSDEEFFEIFRTYFSDRHAESTITDYINRIKTFRNKYARMYLEAFYGESYVYDNVEVGHIYDALEYILATFKPKSKTELNIYSALKKLNEYKHHREQE